MPLDEATRRPASTGSATATPDAPGEGRTSYRWVICAMIFLATTINYIDRQVLGILAPTLTDQFSWSETDYASIVSWFSFAYAFGYLLMGRFTDRVGVKLGYAVSIVGWSVAAMLHAIVRTVPGFSIARAGLTRQARSAANLSESRSLSGTST